MAIRWEKLTVKSQEAMQAASTLATENGNPEILPLHLLSALLEDKDGIIAPLLQKVGVTPECCGWSCSAAPRPSRSRSRSA